MDGRIRESIDLWTRADSSELRIHTNTGASRDPWIRESFDPWMFGLLQAGRSPKLRILGFRERWVSRSLDSDDRDRESLGSDHSGITEGPFDP